MKNNINHKIIVRIKELLKQRNWTANHLAIESGISPSTIINWFNRKATPSINAMASICDSFGITMSEFFNETNMHAELTSQQKELLSEWDLLHKAQKDKLLEFIITTNNIIKKSNPL